MAMTLVSTTTVGSGGAASIEFTNIPQTGKDLLILVSGRSTTANIEVGATLAFNSSTSNFTAVELFGSGSSTGSGTPARRFALVPGSTTTSNTFGNAAVYVANYAGSTNKSYSSDSVLENNATDSYQSIYAGLWSNTAAITTVTLTETGNNWVQHTTASLYIIS